MRRLTRQTSGLAEKVDDLTAAAGLRFMHYNFCRVHKTLGTTPAVAAGIADSVWTLDDLIGVLVEAESVPVRRSTGQTP